MTTSIPSTATHGKHGLSILNRKRKILPGPELLHELLSTAAHPHDIAIDHLDADGSRHQYTYEAVRQYTKLLAKKLRNHVVDQDDRQSIVPVIIPQCPELYISYLAVLQAGAGFCPISPDTPVERLKFVIGDVSAKVALTIPAFRSHIEASLPDIVCVQVSLKTLDVDLNSDPRADHVDHDDSLVTVSSNETAYVMYTSGSTGLPKGVKVSHGSATQSLLAHEEHLPSFKRFLQFASPTFDVSVFEIFFPLFRGATLVCCEREGMLADLPGTIRCLDVDAAELTPTVAGTLLRRRSAVPCLKILLTIGEMLTRHVIDEFGGSKQQESMLYAMYGPTEAAIHCTLAPRLSTSSSVRNIGVPLSTVSAFILDESNDNGKPGLLPIGQIGELGVAGQLASGYLNRPDQTTAAFIDLPGHGRIYRTGDRAVIGEDGTLQILGRMSSGQVKLRGQRVELGEIEEIACKTSGVELAVASIINDAVILFCSGTSQLQTQDVQTVCKSWLPRFMRPSEIVLMGDNIPRLPSGKIDRRRLEANYLHQSSIVDNKNKKFETPIEQHIAQVLGTELDTKITADSSLRSLGLDSLRAIKVASALRSTYPHVSVSMLLESEHVGELATSLATDGSAGKANNGTEIEIFEESQSWRLLQSELSDSFHEHATSDRPELIEPCSSMQIAMLTETLAEEDMNFNIITLQNLQHISQADVKYAFCKVAIQNRLLRSGFMPTDRAEMPFVQLVWPELSFDYEISMQRPMQILSGTNPDDIVVKIHHALYDGWSWDLILSDVDRTLQGLDPIVRPQFDEYRRASLRRNASQLDNDTDYWTRILDDFRPTAFPKLSSKAISERHRPALVREFAIKTDVLERFCTHLRISKQTVLQAAIIMALSAYCNSKDITCGIVLSGREEAFPGIDQLIGPCLKTLPLRIDLSAVASVRDLLLYLQRQQMQCLKHDSLSLGQISRASGVGSGNPLFDTLCVWQQGLNDFLRLKHFRPVDTHDVLNYAFVFEAWPESDKVKAKITCNSNVLPLDHARLLLHQLDELTSFLVSDESVQLSGAWASLSSATQATSNTNYSPFDLSFDFATTLRRIAKTKPNHKAIEFVHDFDLDGLKPTIESLTYEELHNQSSCKALELAGNHGVRPDDLVCIMLEKSTDLYIMILAVVLAGAGYICIDPKAPDDRVKKILDEAKCKLIISGEVERCQSCSDKKITVVTIQDLSSSTADRNTDLSKTVSPEALAYAVFTSGSTGVPKGVLITRRNLLSNIDNLSRIYPCQPATDKLLQSCSQAFDVSVFEIFWTWHMGMTLCSARNDVLFRDIEKLISALSITHLSMTPSVAALIHPSRVPDVKCLVTAGEPMNSKVFMNWSEHGLFQGYGPSETTNICNVRPRVSAGDFINNVGPAFSNTSIFICEPQANQQPTIENSAECKRTLEFLLLPKGAVGEVWVGGDQVGRGYIDKTLTSQSWLDHPSYGRLYRSGDIGRLLADNTLVIVGRLDDQVKIRGLRIELGEINSALVRHVDLRDAVTIVVDKPSKPRLVAFVVSAPTAGERADQEVAAVAFEWLATQVPDYMLPDIIIPLDKIPLTQQAKVDHRLLASKYSALDEMHRVRLSRGSQTNEAQEELSIDELKIAGVLSRTMGIADTTITRRSSFYGHGLDSISSIRFARALHKEGFRHLDVSTILRNPSIAQLLLQLKQEDSQTQKKSITGSRQFFSRLSHQQINARYADKGFTVEHILPCTPLQIAMLSSSSSGQSIAYYNRLKLKANVGLQDLRRAWVRMVERHTLLRTGFVETDDTDMPFAQVILAHFDIPWTSDDVSNSTFPNENFNTPPYCFVTADHDGQPELVLNIHHALYDAEAMALLLHEVEESIKGIQSTKPVPFTRYIEYMIDMDTQQVDTFWSKRLAGVSPTRLMDLTERSARIREQSAPVPIVAQSRLPLDRFEKFLASQSTTILPVVQASMARLLRGYTGKLDVCFGTVYNGRNLPIDDVDSIIGPCFNTLPTRVQFGRHQPTKDLVQVLLQQNLDVIPFQPSSLRRIQRNHSPDGKALFDILLLLQHDELALDRSIWEILEDNGDMGVPFILEVQPDRMSNTLSLTLHDQCNDKDFASTLLQNFDRVLYHSITYPQVAAVDLDLIRDFLPSLAHGSKSQQPSVEQNLDKHADRTQWTPAQTDVREVLMELSDSKDTNMHLSTTIFKIGLDSISAVQAAFKLRQRGFHITGADIMDRPTIEEIAQTCLERSNLEAAELSAFDFGAFDTRHRSQATQRAGIQKEDVEALLPCTPTQSGMLIQFLESNGLLYYNRTRLLLDRHLSSADLRKAWIEVMQRHEMLRTGFIPLDSAKFPFAMVVYKPDAVELPWRDHVHGDERDDNTAGDKSTSLEVIKDPCWNVEISTENGNIYLDISILHALYDAQSFRTILTEAFALTDGIELSIPPAITSAMSHILQSSEHSDAAERFWTDMREDMIPTRFPDLRIYHDKRLQFDSHSHTSDIPPTVLREKCRHLGVSLQTICQAAWAKLLAAYTGESQVTFGVILSGRDFDDEALKNVVFPCINVLPLAINVESEPDELLRLVSRRNAGLLKYQHSPLHMVKKYNNLSDNLFDTVIVLQKFQQDFNTHTSWSIVEEDASAEYAVSMEVMPRDNEHLQYNLTFKQNIMPSRQAAIILNQFDALIKRELGIQVVIADENLMSVLPPKDEVIPTDTNLLHELVENTAKRTPSRTALEFVTAIDDEKVQKNAWSYAELHAKSNQMANLIIDEGAEVGDLVAVCFDKCPEASFAILGVLKAGCGYVAIDPGAPKARKDFILEDAKCRVILTTSDKVHFFDGTKVPLLSVNDPATIERCSSNQPTLGKDLSPDHTCYCLYTSGTTGAPKGCLISHHSAVQAMLSFSRIFSGRWTDSSRWLQFASFHFDVSVLEHFWTWKEGICMISVPRDMLFEDLPGTINKLGITHLDLTPSLARLLTPEEVPSLCDGVFIVGGEQLRQDVLDTWGEVGCLYNFYGPSEVTIGCTVHPQVPKNAKSTNIGRQWDNVGSFVLAPKSQDPVLRGALGELCLSGPLVGKGYLNRPELTAEKFINLRDHNGPVYRTGDLVRMLHDGSFDFVGRIDGQVKLRGQRLEVGEINHVILDESTQIKDASTLVIKHPQQEKEQLVSFFATSPSTKMGKNRPQLLFDSKAKALDKALRESFRNRLPPYMVPTYLIAIDYMPLSVNNKIDGKALKSIFEGATLDQIQGRTAEGEPNHPGMASCTHQLIEVLASYLNIDSSAVRHSSSLLQLGLDSISAIGLSRILKKEGLRSAEVSTIMRNSSVDSLAQALSKDEADKDSGNNFHQRVKAAKQNIAEFQESHANIVCETLNVGIDEIDSIAPCTPLQEGMIARVVSSDGPNVPYLGSFTFKLHKGTNTVSLQRAWRNVTDCIGILKTRFVSTEDGFAQVVLRQPIVEGISLSAVNALDELQRVHEQWTRKIKYLGKNLPWQINFARDDTDAVYMSLCIFHGLYDGICLPLLLDAVKHEYTHHTTELGDSIQFHDVLPYGPLLKQPEGQKFWQNNIKTVSLLDLDSDSDTPRRPLLMRTSIKLPTIQGLCHELDVTTPAVFHAAWLWTLFCRYGINPTLGIVLSGRALAIDDSEKVIGPMLNTVPSSIKTTSDDSNIYDLVQSCHHFNVDVLPFQHSSIREITKWLGRSPNSKLFDALFVFLKEEKIHMEDKHQLWDEQDSESQPDYPLNLEIEQKTDLGVFGITILATENAKLTREDVSDLQTALQDNIQAICRRDVVKLPVEFNGGEPLRTNESSMSNLDYKNAGNSIVREWSSSALKLRHELASLASTDENNIGLNNPSIFELGLDSIDALKLAARLKRTGISIPTSKIMQYPTVGGMTSQIQEASETTSNSLSPARSIKMQQEQWRANLLKQHQDLTDIEAILPVTFMQEGLLLDHKNYYHILPYKIRPDANIVKLSQAIENTICGLASMRSHFIAVDDIESDESFLQLVKKSFDGSVTHMEPSPETKIRDVITNLMDENAQRDLVGQTFCSVIVEYPEQSFLLLCLPHAMFDGWSIRLFVNRIDSSYQDQKDKAQPSSMVATHLDEVREQLADPATEQFWQRSLANAKSTLFEASETPSQTRKAKVSHVASKIPAKAIRKTLREVGITMQSLGFACWKLVLAHNTRSLDVTHGIVLSGRTSEGSDELVFPTFNTVLSRTVLEVGASRPTWLKNVHDAGIEILSHQHFPLKQALRLTNGSAVDLFNTLFTFQKTPSRVNHTSPLLQEHEVEDEHFSPPYAVNVEMTEKGGHVWWTLGVQENVASEKEVSDVIQQLDAVLEELTSTSGKPVVTVNDNVMSICGLSPVTISQNTSRKAANTDDPDLSKLDNSEWTELELEIRRVLSLVARVDESQIAKTTGIFNLGLDSISAIKVASQLRKHGIRLPVSELVHAQDVIHMAKSASYEGKASVDTPAPLSERPQALSSDVLSKLSISPGDIENTASATAGQVYMLDTWRASERNLIQATFWYEADSSQAEIEAAFGILANRLPALRTSFVEDDGKIFAITFKPGIMGQMFPWSLKTAVSRGRVLVELSIHHVLYDAVSLNLMEGLLNELCRFQQIESKLTTDLNSFLNLTQSQDAAANNQRRKFWTSYLQPLTSEAVAVYLPGSFLSPRHQKFTPHVLRVAPLEKKLKECGISIQSLVFAAYARVHMSIRQKIVKRSTATSDVRDASSNYVTLGVYLGNRSHDLKDLPSLIAPTINIVPLKIKIVRDSDSPLLDMAKQIQDDFRLISRKENCGASMRQIYQWTGVKVDGYMNFLRLPDDEDSDEDSLIDEDVSSESSSKLDGHDLSFRHAKGDVLTKVQALFSEAKDASEPQIHANKIVEQLPSPFLVENRASSDLTKSPTSEMSTAVRDEHQDREQVSVHNWSIPSIDFEAKVMKDGWLAMGLFSPQDMLERNDVDFIIQNVGRLVESFVAESHSRFE